MIPCAIMLDQIAQAMVPPPDYAIDVCPTCWSWRHPRHPRCSNCMQAFGELHMPANLAVPISLYRRPSLLRDWLVSYKLREELPTVSAATAQSLLTAIVSSFLTLAWPVLTARLGSVDGIVPVPSSSSTGEGPMVSVLRSSAARFAPVYPQLVSRLRTSSHRYMSESMFDVTQRVEGKRLIVFDDVFTTGSQSQSLSSALQGRGADVPLILVIARRIDPGFNEAVGRVWDRQGSQVFDWADIPRRVGAMCDAKQYLSNVHLG